MAKEAMSSAKLKKVLAALEGDWQAEMEGYHTYLALAERDTDPVRAQVLRHLAGDVYKRQACRCASAYGTSSLSSAWRRAPAPTR